MSSKASRFAAALTMLTAEASRRAVILDDFDDDDDDDEIDEDCRAADIETFVRLLKERPRTYADLLAMTGVSFRTAKKRIADIRRTHDVRDRRQPSLGRGPVVMWIGEAAGEGPALIRTACPIHRGASCLHCDGSGYRTFTRKEWEERANEKAKARAKAAADAAR